MTRRTTKTMLQTRFDRLATLLKWNDTVALHHTARNGWYIRNAVKIKDGCSALEMCAWLDGALFVAEHKHA